MAMIIETVATHRSQWGEGPIWWQGSLYYVDIEGHAINRYTPATGAEHSWNVGQRVGTIVPRANGGFVAAGDHGFFYFDEHTGIVSAIADPEFDRPNNRFNDGKCSPDGYFFAGSISLVKQTGDAALYRLAADGSVVRVLSGVTNSNGIAWSADGETCYYIDTPRRSILAFDYARGELSEEREVVKTRHIDASPDGMCIDADGNLWVAFCHGGCVCCFDPRTGEQLRRIEIPCLETTACWIGGDDGDDLFVTTGVHRTVVEADAGRLWVVRGLGVRAAATHAFVG